MYHCCFLKNFLPECHHHQPATYQKTFLLYPSFCLLSSCRQMFWLIVRRLRSFSSPMVHMIALNSFCQIVQHHHGHHGKLLQRLLQRCCGGSIFHHSHLYWLATVFLRHFQISSEMVFPETELTVSGFLFSFSI